MPFTSEEDIYVDYPRLRGAGFEFTSDPNQYYNCISFAVGEKKKWWDPTEEYMACGGLPVWPEGCPRENTIGAWMKALEAVRFLRCDDEAFETGFDKVAIFALSEDRPMHIALQPADRGGAWMSKLGEDADICHALEAVGGPCGSPMKFMKRETKYRGDKSLLALAKPALPRPTRRPPLHRGNDQ